MDSEITNPLSQETNSVDVLVSERSRLEKKGKLAAPQSKYRAPKGPFTSPRRHASPEEAVPSTIEESRFRSTKGKKVEKGGGQLSEFSEFSEFSTVVKTISFTQTRSKKTGGSPEVVLVDMNKVFTTIDTPPYLTEHFFSLVKHKDKRDVVAFLTSDKHRAQFYHLMHYAGVDDRRRVIKAHALDTEHIDKNNWHYCWAQAELSFVEQALEKQKLMVAQREEALALRPESSTCNSPDGKLASEAGTTEENISYMSPASSSSSSSPCSASSQSPSSQKRRASYPEDLPGRFPQVSSSWLHPEQDRDRQVSGANPGEGRHQEKDDTGAQGQVLGLTVSEGSQMPGVKPGKGCHQEKDGLGAQEKGLEATVSDDSHMCNPEWGSAADVRMLSQKAHADTKQPPFGQSADKKSISQSLRDDAATSQKEQGTTERIPENCPESQEGDDEPSYESKRAVSPPWYTYGDDTNREDDRSSNRSAPSHTYILNQLFVNITPNSTADFAPPLGGEAQPGAQESQDYVYNQAASADRAKGMGENPSMPAQTAANMESGGGGRQQHSDQKQPVVDPGTGKGAPKKTQQAQSTTATGLKKPTEKPKPATKSWLHVASQTAGKNTTAYRYVSKPISKVLPEKAATQTRWYNRWAKKGLTWFKLLVITLNTIAVRRILVGKLSKTALRVWAVQWVAFSLALMLAVCLWMSFRWVQTKWAKTTTKQPSKLSQSHLARALVVAIDTAKKVLSLQENGDNAVYKLPYVPDAVASSSLDDFGVAIERRYPKTQGQVPIKDRQTVEVAVDAVNKTYTLALK